MVSKERSANNEFTVWHELLLKFLRKVITDTNVWLLKVSRGRLGNSFLGVPVLVITTLGRKSGQPRSQPLYYMTFGPNIILVASNAGTATDPAWLLNLRTNPNVSVDVHGEVREMIARMASTEEKAELWPKMTKMFPKWQMMEDRSKRSFPVIILEPVTE